MVVQRLHRPHFVEEGVVGGGLRVASCELGIDDMLQNNNAISTALHSKKQRTHRGLQNPIHIRLVHKLPLLSHQHIHESMVKLLDCVVELGGAWYKSGGHGVVCCETVVR